MFHGRVSRRVRTIARSGLDVNGKAKTKTVLQDFHLRLPGWSLLLQVRMKPHRGPFLFTFFFLSFLSGFSTPPPPMGIFARPRFWCRQSPILTSFLVHT
jgi:hypothetical protein